MIFFNIIKKGGRWTIPQLPINNDKRQAVWNKPLAMIQAFLVPIVVCWILILFSFQFLVLRFSLSIQNASIWTSSASSSFCNYWICAECFCWPYYRFLQQFNSLVNLYFKTCKSHLSTGVFSPLLDLELECCGFTSKPTKFLIFLRH